MTEYRPLPATRTKEVFKPSHQAPTDTTSNRLGATFDAGDSRASSHTQNTADADESGQSLSGLKRLQDSSKYEKARFSFRLYKR